MVELSECCFRGCSGCNIYNEMFPVNQSIQDKEDKDGTME
jgi:hypothetical protein